MFDNTIVFITLLEHFMLIFTEFILINQSYSYDKMTS